MRGQGGESFALNNRMQRYGANVLGSNSYMAERKKELMALINDEGLPTIWWTLSLANNYWDDLNKLFGDPPVIDEIETEDAFEKRWKKLSQQNYTNHPHVVNEYFVKRVKYFVDSFFEEQGLEAAWTWYRFEWQKRGNVHVHGMGKLTSDPGLAALAIKVQEGRQLQKLLMLNREYKRNNLIECSYELHEFRPPPDEDVHLATHLERAWANCEQQGMVT